MDVHCTSNKEFIVMSSDGQRAVDTAEKQCDCVAWQHTGLPCAHVCAAVSYAGID